MVTGDQLLIMQETKEITTTKTITKAYCDICNDKGIKCCLLCKRDLCIKHITFDPRDLGDYPDVYCESCWNIGEGYRRAIDDIQNAADVKIEKQEENWKAAAIKALEPQRI